MIIIFRLGQGNQEILLRTFVFILIALGTALAGVYYGKSDYARRRVSGHVSTSHGPDDGASPATRPADAGPTSDRSPGASPVESEESSLPAPSPEALQTQILEAIGREIETLRQTIHADGVVAASETAASALEALLEDHQDAFLNDAALLAALQPLRRRILKTNVFAAVVRPIERENLPDRFYRVALVNGNDLWAKRVARGVDTYDLELYPSGKASMARRDINNVKEVSIASFLDGKRQRIVDAASALKEPITLYVRGVRELYSLGLENDGYKLLERVLDMPESKQVPSVFVSDPDGTLVRRWEQAAGRMELEPLEAESNVEIVEETTSPDEPRFNDQSEITLKLREARLRLKQAQSIYRDVVVNQTRDLTDLHQARRKLDQANQILSRLPRAHPAVETARQSARTLLQAVIKSTPLSD